MRKSSFTKAQIIAALRQEASRLQERHSGIAILGEAACKRLACNTPSDENIFRLIRGVPQIVRTSRLAS